MKPPHRDRFEDDPEGYERAWSYHEERMEDLRDRERDEKAEKETEQKDEA